MSGKLDDCHYQYRAVQPTLDQTLPSSSERITVRVAANGRERERRACRDRVISAGIHRRRVICPSQSRPDRSFHSQNVV